jgi:hypothetical protein
MTTQQLYRRDLRPGDTYGASLNDATPTFRVDEDGDTIDLRNGAVRYHGLSTMVHHVIRAATPSTPPAPVRKGRVGMRLKGNETGRIVTLTDGVACAGLWAAYLDGITVVYVDDESIGSLWTVLPDAPADARAEAVQLRRDDLRVGDRFDYATNAISPRYQVRDEAHDVYRNGAVYLAHGDRPVYAVIRAAAPVATPEVVRAAPKPPVPRCTSEFLADYEQRQREAPHDHRPIPRATREMWSAAVTLRLAARAEERRLREQQHCQPNWAGGDDVDE